MDFKGKFMSKAVIKSLAVYLPEDIVYNHHVENKINAQNVSIANGTLEKLFGCHTRRFAPKTLQVSDIACEAAKQILNIEIAHSIELLIFAAASSDLIEPATANIIQTKLGLTCPVMDIKNACNSFVSAIQISTAFIESGMYKNILIVGGEKLSEVINYNPRDNEHLKRCLAGYTLGDAGAAMILGEGNGSKIIYQKFSSWGEYWNLCTVEGGGSMAFRNFDKYYFEGNSTELSSVFRSKLAIFVFECFSETSWTISDIDLVVSHQVSSTTCVQIAEILEISKDKFINTFSMYGNTAAVTIPLALHEAVKDGKLKKGDKIMLLGLAAGISLSVQLVEW